MRPARKGPENLEIGARERRVPGVASMRPARKGPENHVNPATSSTIQGGFNEAGPQGAGKPITVATNDAHLSMLQ